MKGGTDLIGFLGADDVQQFQQLLGMLVADTRAQCALLVDRAGRLLCRVGDGGGTFDETTFASLASADFAASDQLAVLLGEQEFNSLYHHGADRSMFLADIAGAAILAVLFDFRTTLGMVRIRSKSLVPVMAGVLAQIVERGPSGPMVHIEAGWAADAESEIDRLFSE